MSQAWGDVHARIHTNLRQRLLLPNTARILIAVSGGQDSACLLKLLVDLQPHWAWRLEVIHCNHRWRDDANDNAEFVQALSHRFDLPCHVRVTEQPLTSENQARAWRYAIFGELARELGCAYVVTGHTATDQAETLLLHLFRGTGLGGLGGMAWSRSLGGAYPDIQLVRPLLDLTRPETAQFCQERGLDIWLDSTNANLDLRRNRLRLEIMPQLRQYFNPQADRVLAQTATLCQAEQDYLDQETQKHYATVVNEEIPGLAVNPLQTLHPALQRCLIRRFLQEIFEITPQFAHVEGVLNLIFAPKNSQSSPLPKGIVAWVDPPWIKFPDLG
ncbi:tRNA lysidine(34) synthetase TilS [Synechococcus sp. PCC 6312]|uniref:tRNA lysidine(34) synthetase TilS n=1 Tax=Synechococcus sp. (strain ATCC 27167 / PCC 6312) TaxID=195253 RepID=UPI00029EE794|nr:tRNA lysidine(34) synthetase TilS [Synechococcus sp. PCC 6312]AFY60515.1 tRNA(Ile)-lysidine synthetase [Synechococcus sp. PCC 6312]